MARKIIFKARVGSHLHGTNTPTSDEDFLGVFLPSVEDLLGMQNRPKEWTENEKISDGARNTAGDTDCKYLALYEFFKQAADGQSQALELFFVPDEHVIIKTPEWDEIIRHKHHFLSKQSILPFIGFARAQMHKAVIKGDNLNKINTLIDKTNELVKNGKGSNKLIQHLAWPGDFHDDPEISAFLFGVPVKFHRNEHDVKVIRIANRDYDTGVNVKHFRDSMVKLEEKYGSRTRLAAALTYDFKSVTHAFRLLYEAEELLATGKITFPRPEANNLKDIKEGLYLGDINEDIEKRLDIIRQQIEPKSPLTNAPDYSRINQLCQTMLKEVVK